MISLLKKLRMKKYDYLYLILLTIISSLIIFFKVTSSFRMFSGYNYDSDFGRDLLRMYEILHGKFTLIGPQLSFAGLHMAPYSYYLFAPFLFLGNFDHRALFFANGSLFMIEFFILFLLLKNRWGKNYSFLSILWLITTPYIILSSRSPGNAFSYIIFLFFIFYILFYKKNISTKLHFIIGIIEGLIINFHPINILVTTPLHIGTIAMQKSESFIQKVKKIIFSLIGTELTFLPLLVLLTGKRDWEKNIVLNCFCVYCSYFLL